MVENFSVGWKNIAVCDMVGVWLDFFSVRVVLSKYYSWKSKMIYKIVYYHHKVCKYLPFLL